MDDWTVMRLDGAALAQLGAQAHKGFNAGELDAWARLGGVRLASLQHVGIGAG